MALITTEAREDLITLAIGMFNAAPGANYLDQLVDAYEAGASIQNIADALATKSQFNDIYPTHQTAEEFAASLVDNLLTDSTSASTKEWATNWVETQINGGATKAEVIIDAVAALRATTNENYADAQAQLANRVEVATYYSVEQQLSSKDIGELQAVIAEVTSDEDTVDTAKEDIDDVAGANGDTFTLTVGPDAVEGTSANDVFNALNIDGTGSAATTVSTFDNLDGAAGNDTLNIYSDAANNASLPSNVVIENIEIVNIFNDGAAGAFGDASRYVGVEQLWQIEDADAVTKLLASTTAGFRDIAAGTLSVAAASGAASANVALDGVDDATTLTITGTSTANISGNVVDSATDGVDPLGTTVDVGTKATTATVNSGVDIDLTLVGAALKSIDASGSTGGVDTVAAAAITSIKTGSGDDAVTTTTATTATANATVDTGDGDDEITVSTTGTAGTVTVNAGAGDDAVELTTDPAGKLTVNLGAGEDVFNVSGTGVVSATDVVDGGADVDTLLLSIVGVANIGAFQNFELFDVAGLINTLDVDILATKNTVTEIVASEDLGAGGATLTNVGAGVGYRVIGDTGADALTITQKTAGALTLALDIDESGAVAATTAITDADATVVATNATTITANLDSDFVGKATGAGDNETQFNITGDKATSLTVNSSGDNASNELVHVSTDGKLATVTVTGDSDLALDVTSAGLTTVDASAFTADLTFDTAQLKGESVTNTFDGGQLKLGAGDDVIDLFQGAKISGVDLADGEDETAQDGFDVFTAATNTQALDAATADVDVENGLATFLGQGPATLAEAIADVDAAVAGGAAVFEYIGNSYIFVDGGEVVQLVGVTGLEGLDDIGGTSLYVF